ncbi:hypothetical protein C8R45DRAFT_520868 [Mycena sanguinolenta]|nr:hypothetical protein C8R45DRAFT_520868 [Mycena sanguinolenta]
MSGLTPTLPRVSGEEATCFYSRLPSCPLLVARTGNIPYESPRGPWQHPMRRELRIVGKHTIQDVWEDDLACKVHSILDTNQTDWTSTDVVRIAYLPDQSGFTTPPDNDDVVLWIGVDPGSLSYEDGIVVALQCKQLLLDYGLEDVNVEIRESELVHSSGPKLFGPLEDPELNMSFHYSAYNDPVDVRAPFTSMLGIPVCAQSTFSVEGTGGFFLDEGGDGKRLLLVTARHVVFNDDNKTLCENNSDDSDHDVLLFNDASFQQHLATIQNEIRLQGRGIEIHQQMLDEIEGDDEKATRAREHAQGQLNTAKAKAADLTALHEDLSTHWATPESRRLGHVVCSPPFAVTEQYTQDIAVDRAKIDPSTGFVGNVIDLGTKFPVHTLERMMCARAAPRLGKHENEYAQWKSGEFSFPSDRLLRLRGVIPAAELRLPRPRRRRDMLPDLDSAEPDEDEDDFGFVVLKSGRGSGLTIGRANNVFSYVRRRHPSTDAVSISKEWPILPYLVEPSRGFSAPGDSGAVVVDARGRMGGMITGGAGCTAKPKGAEGWAKGRDAEIDVTYATPMEFVLRVIRGREGFGGVELLEAPETD